jgi:hypothetical protein
LVVIALGSARIVDRLFVGLGAHHMAIGPHGRRMWIALGERASQIAIVDLSRPGRPRVLRRFSPRFVAHDLTFAPDGRRVWVTSGAGNAVHVLNPRSGKEVFSVFVGTGPQHVVFAEPEGSAFVTSGYANKIVKVDARTGRIVKIAYTPPGSFNLSSSGGLVVTTSLFQGASRRSTQISAACSPSKSRARPAPSRSRFGRSPQTADKTLAEVTSPLHRGHLPPRRMSKEENHEEPESTPPGHFVTDDLRAQTARFLDELKKRLRREKAQEPKLGPPR